ncbi:MAG: glutathione S-transferase family protein [Kiloniellaceae bacterium]
MVAFTIVLGNKAYSSWSLRAWLALKQTGIDFDEVVVPLHRPETREEILAHSPSGRVPALKAGELTIWDSLAIAEYLDERFPAAGLWPRGPAARATARAVAAEMHAGFATIRRRLAMDLRRREPGEGRSPEMTAELAAEIARIVALWSACRARFGATGDFLFGGFSAADACYAPVVTRFVTYGIALDGAAAAYRDAIMAWPALRDWIAAAEAEPWVIENP